MAETTKRTIGSMMRDVSRARVIEMIKVKPQDYAIPAPMRSINKVREVAVDLHIELLRAQAENTRLKSELEKQQSLQSIAQEIQHE